MNEEQVPSIADGKKNKDELAEDELVYTFYLSTNPGQSEEDQQLKSELELLVERLMVTQ